MAVAEVLLSASALIVLVPTIVVLVQVAAALPRDPVRAAAQAPRRPRLAVLVPAHNEAARLPATLAAIRPQLFAGDRVVVIADNCSDNTAEVASAASVEVVERANLTLRGKGYALDAGRRHLEKVPPDIVVVVDADCILAEGALDELARACDRAGRPTQALYLMESTACRDTGTRVAQFAWIVKNWVRPLGMRRLGLPCPLFGSGMAFPWSFYSAAPLATGCLVEDLALGIHAARTGASASFCPQARVYSRFPTGRSALTGQRRRWEHGHLSMIAQAPRLVREALARRDSKLLALAIDLCVPPLALLVLAVGVLALAALVFYAWTGASAPTTLAAGALANVALAVLLAWARFGRGVISLRDLAYGVVYAASKIPLYAAFMARRQVQWIRTPRDSSE